MKLRAAEVLPRFRERRNKVRMLGASQRHHGKAVRKRSEVLFEFVRRPARGNEMQFVEIEPPVGCAGHANVTTVNGIERAAKQSDAARMEFGGSAVRLRYRQCASHEVSMRDFLTNFRLWQRHSRTGPT